MKIKIVIFILLSMFLNINYSKANSWKEGLVNNDTYSRNTIVFKNKETGFNLLRDVEISEEGTINWERDHAINLEEVISSYRLYPQISFVFFMIYDTSVYTNKHLTWILTQKSPNKDSPYLGLTLKPTIGLEKIY